MEIIQYPLEDHEYVHQETEKDTIILHHTAGNHNPKSVVDWWNMDYNLNEEGEKVPRLVATHYIIGGNPPTRIINVTDGKIMQCFDEKYWAGHVGKNVVDNRSIGIEICNWGALRMNKDGFLFNEGKEQMNPEDCYNIDYRGFKWYHKYTNKQIESLIWLIEDIRSRHPKMQSNWANLLQYKDPFGDLPVISTGLKGLFTHGNIIPQKSDISPYPPLIEALKKYFNMV